MVRRIRDIMSTKLETLSPDSTMEEAVRIEMRHHIRHIPIVENGVLVGIVTDRDIKRAMPSLLSGLGSEEHDRVLKTTPVSRLMTKSPQTITPEAPLQDAVRILCEKKFGALPVVDAGKLVGIVTEIDLLRVFLQMLEA